MLMHLKPCADARRAALEDGDGGRRRRRREGDDDDDDWGASEGEDVLAALGPVFQTRV